MSSGAVNKAEPRTQVVSAEGGKLAREHCLARNLQISQYIMLDSGIMRLAGCNKSGSLRLGAWHRVPAHAAGRPAPATKRGLALVDRAARCDAGAAVQKKRTYARKQPKPPPLPTVRFVEMSLIPVNLYASRAGVLDTDRDGHGLFTADLLSSLPCSLPLLLQPQGHQQQTLFRSFTLGGIGLHTGEYGEAALVVIQPSFHCATAL